MKNTSDRKLNGKSHTGTRRKHLEIHKSYELKMCNITLNLWNSYNVWSEATLQRLDPTDLTDKMKLNHQAT